MSRALLARSRERARYSALRFEIAAQPSVCEQLRNPLAPILTAVHVMRLRGATPAWSRELDLIERQLNHAVALVDDLLDVSRLTRGVIEIARESLELARAVTQAVEMTQGLIEQRRHSLALDVPETGLMLEGDAHRLAQVVSNLLTNAARYMEPGGSISVRARSVEDRIELSVRDTGPGIAPDVLPTIFELFTQGPQSIERRQGGLGLGLFIVRSLVALHGGTADVSTALGQGTELIVSLPRSRALSSRLPARMLESHGPGALGRRVLVVDDNVDAADLVAEGLRIHGCEVSVAHDAPSSLQLALSQRPEVAIVDIGLPGIDGWELGTQLRALPGMHGLRVIAMSGYGQERDRARSSAASFAAQLVKPVDLEALLAALA